RMLAFQATRRGLTDRETTMEDTHVWVMNADGTGRRDLGAAVDNRQGAPLWAPDGSAVLFTVQERGNVRLYRAPLSSTTGVKPEPIVSLPGTVGSFSMVRDTLAYTSACPSDLAELYVLPAGSAVSIAKRLTDLNAQVLTGKSIAQVEAFTFVSNDNRFEVEAFLTRPVDAGAAGSDAAATPKYPLIVNIHGGPHGQQGV